MLSKVKKDHIIAKYRTHASDTGSSQVQIAILTEEIKELTNHLKEHKKDNSSRRGLLKKVADRRRLLRYLSKEDAAGYEKLIKDLKLKTVVEHDDDLMASVEDTLPAAIEKEEIEEKEVE